MPVSGVCRGGLSTTPQPAAIAGATLWAARLSGKLNGVIAPTTPIGTRIVQPRRPTPAGCASTTTPRPASVRASTAEKVIVCTARSTSTSACVTGLPASSASVRASSWRRSRMIAAARSRMAARSCEGRPAAIASAAASTATRAESAPTTGTVPTSESSKGEWTSMVSPPATASPATCSGVTRMVDCDIPRPLPRDIARCPGHPSAAHHVAKVSFVE